MTGEYYGTLQAFENTGSGYTELTGTDNPFNGIDVNYWSAPSFVDLDGDGDLDLVSGAVDGTFRAFENTGSGYTALIGAPNPFDAIDIGGFSRQSFVDIDGDGDLDLVSGEINGTLQVWENSAGAPVSGQIITVNITAENDSPTISGDQAITVDEGNEVVLTMADFAGADGDDADGDLTYTVSAASNGAVRVAGATVTTFTNAQLVAGDVSFLHDGSETMTGGFSVSVADDEGAASATLVITATVTPVNDAPQLDDVAASVTFAENTVNAAPQLLDADVTLSDPEGNFDGGTLSVNGLLAEDTVSVQNVGMGAGEIGFDGTNVSFGGVTIGTLVGGAGTDLTITFNATATTAMVEAVIENLTYSNSSDAPVASRDLGINVTDSDGADLGLSGGYVNGPELTGTDNPFDGVNVGARASPTFVDLDGDGDLDAVIGRYDGTFSVFDNNDSDNGFTELTGTDNPLDGIDAGFYSTATFVDLDGDGDLDLVSGDFFGRIKVFDNNDADDGFTELAAIDNPFSDILISSRTTPTFVDLDEDGDMDLVVGAFDGTFYVYDNNDADDGFTALVGAANPLDGLAVISFSIPKFFDMDGDGDLDLLSGSGSSAGLIVFDNNDNDNGFTEIVRASIVDNPANGNQSASAAFVDIDGDGDLDLVVGNVFGNIEAFENASVSGQVITVNVTSQNDAPTLTGDGAIAVDEGSRVVLTTTDFVGADVDDDLSALLYNVSSQANGRVQIAGADTTIFTHAQLVAGDVSFLQDGSETVSGGFDVIVDDDENGVSTALTITATVTPTNDAPTISGDQAIAVDEGGAVVLTTADFEGVDADDASSDLTYTVSAAINGAVRVAGATVTSFMVCSPQSGP